MLNDLQRPPMASEVGSDVIRSPICGVKEQKLLVDFCSQRPPSWCFIESHFHMLNDLQRPPMASEDKHHVIRPPHLWGQGTKVISALLFPEATFMVFLNSVPGRRTRTTSLAIHRPAWDAGKNVLLRWLIWHGGVFDPRCVYTGWSKKTLHRHVHFSRWRNGPRKMSYK